MSTTDVVGGSVTFANAIVAGEGDEFRKFWSSSVDTMVQIGRRADVSGVTVTLRPSFFHSKAQMRELK